MESRVLGISVQVKLQNPERKDLERCPLGTIGNLQFNAEQGGTARASGFRIFLSKIQDLLSDLLDGLTYHISDETEQARAQRVHLAVARENSRYIGNLLGSLTASAGDRVAYLSIAEQLMELSDSSKGNLFHLVGGKESLSFYLSEMSDSDLIALHNGVLGCPDARGEVLGLIGNMSLFGNGPSTLVLDQVAAAVRQQFIKKVVQEPLKRITDLLSNEPIDGPKLKESLIRLARGLDQFEASRNATAVPSDGDPLDSYLRLLPEEQSETLLTHCLSARLLAAQDVLAMVDDSSETLAVAMLSDIGDSLARAFRARAQPELAGKLNQTEHAERQLLVSKALYDLSADVDRVMRTKGALSEEAYERVRNTVDDAMSLFRDAENNPIGSLNRASLKRLSDATLWYLHRASGLRTLGLYLEPEALNEEGLARAEAHLESFKDALPEDPLSSKALLSVWDEPRPDAVLKALPLIDDPFKRRSVEAALASIRKDGF